MRKKLILAFAASCVVFASCTAVVEEATEQAGDEIELDDIEGGNPDFTIEGDGEEGTFDVESDEGDLLFSGGTELVDGWPSQFSLPDDAVVIASVITNGEDGTPGFSTVFEGPPGSFDSYAEHFRGLAPVAVEGEAPLDGGQLISIEWGTEDDPIGFLLLMDDGDVVTGQIGLGLQ